MLAVFFTNVLLADLPGLLHVHVVMRLPPMSCTKSSKLEPSASRNAARCAHQHLQVMICKYCGHSHVLSCLPANLMLDICLTYMYVTLH